MAKRHVVMKKRAVCRLTYITVIGKEYGRSLAYGAEVDLLERDAAGTTLEKLLGKYIAGFEVIESAVQT